MTQERLQKLEIKRKISNSKQLKQIEQKTSQNENQRVLILDDAIRKLGLRSGRVNVARISAASSESRLPNSMLSLHSATVLDTFYGWCLNKIEFSGNAEALHICHL